MQKRINPMFDSEFFCPLCRVRHKVGVVHPNPIARAILQTTPQPPYPQLIRLCPVPHCGARMELMINMDVEYCLGWPTWHVFNGLDMLRWRAKGNRGTPPHIVMKNKQPVNL